MAVAGVGPVLRPGEHEHWPLDLAERFVQRVAEHLAHEGATHQTIAMLSRQRAAEFQHHAPSCRFGRHSRLHIFVHLPFEMFAEFLIKFSLHRFALKRRLRFRGPRAVATVASHWSREYYHWIIDALPRLWLIRNGLADHVLLLPDSHRVPFIVDSLAANPALRRAI